MRMGKLLPQRFTTATGLARGFATLIARQVLANDEASEPTIGLGRRGCCWWTGPSAKCSWCALHVLRRLDFIARVARDRCVPLTFGDKQVVFAGDFFRFPPVPNAEDDWCLMFLLSFSFVVCLIPASHTRDTVHDLSPGRRCIPGLPLWIAEWVWCWRGVHAWAFEAGCDSHQRQAQATFMITAGPDVHLFALRPHLSTKFAFICTSGGRFA